MCQKCNIESLAAALQPDWSEGRPLPEDLPPGIFRRLLHAANESRRQEFGPWYHYNGYNVGAAGIGPVEGFDHMEMVFSRNRKHQPGECPGKCCAESEAARRAALQGISWFKFFMLIAPQHADDATARNLDYLVPCGQCRNEHWNLNGVFREETFIILGHPYDDNSGLPLIGYRFGRLVRHLGHYEGYWHAGE